MDIRQVDGSGNGFAQKIDNRLRAWNDSVSRTQFQQAILEGNGYNFSTGIITLTSALPSAVFWIKNDGDLTFVFKEIGIRLGTPAGGVGSTAISLSANNSGGTIITNETPLETNFNRDLGSKKQIIGAAYKGAQGATLTGGESAGSTGTDFYDDPVTFKAEIFALRKGNDIGVIVTPPAGTTSQTVVVFGTGAYDSSGIRAI